MKLTDNEKRDVVKLIEEGRVLPEKYRFLLFDESKQIELTWKEGRRSPTMMQPHYSRPTLDQI